MLHRARTRSFCIMKHRFQRPNRFARTPPPGRDEVTIKKKSKPWIPMSQFYEWLPWVDGRLQEVPAGATERKSLAEEGAYLAS